MLNTLFCCIVTTIQLPYHIITGDTVSRHRKKRFYRCLFTIKKRLARCESSDGCVRERFPRWWSKQWICSGQLNKTFSSQVNNSRERVFSPPCKEINKLTCSLSSLVIPPAENVFHINPVVHPDTSRKHFQEPIYHYHHNISQNCTPSWSKRPCQRAISLTVCSASAPHRHTDSVDSPPRLLLHARARRTIIVPTVAISSPHA